MLLLSQNNTVRLMLEHEHKRLGHSGAKTVVSNLRQQF